MITTVEYANDVATGGTTTLVASINDDGYMRMLNVGDLVCVVIHEGEQARKFMAKSKEIVHYFEGICRINRRMGRRWR